MGPMGVQRYIRLTGIIHSPASWGRSRELQAWSMTLDNKGWKNMYIFGYCLHMNFVFENIVLTTTISGDEIHFKLGHFFLNTIHTLYTLYFQRGDEKQQYLHLPWLHQRVPHLLFPVSQPITACQWATWQHTSLHMAPSVDLITILITMDILHTLFMIHTCSIAHITCLSWHITQELVK